MIRIILSVLSLGFLVLSIHAIGEPTPEIPGTVAYVDTDHNIVTYDFTTARSFMMSTDANTRRHYQWPTWSVDGRLAYFCCDLFRADSLDTEAYIAPNASSPGEVVYNGNGESIIYAYWSPGTCTTGTDCRELAMLVNDVRNGGLSIEVVRDSAGSTEIRQIGAGNPFYFHYNPDGSEMIFHRNGRTIDIYDIASDATISDRRVSSSQTFQTPAWSPVDDRLLYATRGDETGLANLVVATEGETTVLVENIEGFLSFAWSPDGSKIAYRAVNSETDGTLTVIDSTTGQEVQRGEPGVFAFFWSPDSSRIAYVTLATTGRRSAQAVPIQRNQGPPVLSWKLLRLDTGFNVQLDDFIATYETQYLLLYFDQFAPSHRIWSPDSRYLVYGATDPQDETSQPGIRVLDTEALDREPLVVAEGVFGTWSFE